MANSNNNNDSNNDNSSLTATIDRLNKELSATKKELLAAQGTIHEIQQENQSLREANRDLIQRVTLLEDRSEEYETIKQAFRVNPRLTWMDINHIIIQRNNNIQKVKTTQRMLQREAEEARIEAERQEELERQVIKEYPFIQIDYDKAISKIDKEKHEALALVERFFKLSETEFSEYENTNHDLKKSPIRYAIRFNESSTASYYCRKDEFNIFTLKQIEEHIYSNKEDHKEYVCEQIDNYRIKGMGEATAKYKDRIEEYGKIITDRERNKAAEKREAEERERKRKARERLPFANVK